MIWKNTSKYHSQKTTILGKTFDSKKEAKRYTQLLTLQKAGLIKDLETQKKFKLLDTFKKNGTTYRQISYYADFVYFDIQSKKTIVEDVKASKDCKTDVYKIKKKLFEFTYPDLTIKEIY